MDVCQILNDVGFVWKIKCSPEGKLRAIFEISYISVWEDKELRRIFGRNYYSNPVHGYVYVDGEDMRDLLRNVKRIKRKLEKFRR